MSCWGRRDFWAHCVGHVTELIPFGGGVVATNVQDELVRGLHDSDARPKVEGVGVDVAVRVDGGSTAEELDERSGTS